MVYCAGRNLVSLEVEGPLDQLGSGCTSRVIAAVNKEAARRRPRLMWGVSELPRDPFAAAPVPAALVFMEGELFARPPAPVVFMDDDSGFTGKIVRVMRMPTGVTSAYDGRRCTEGGRHDHASADCGSGKD